MIVTVARYQAITGDETTAASAVSARIEEATELLEERLDRPLVEAERTESMRPSRDGRWLWPRATPISAAEGYVIDGNGLRAPGPGISLFSDQCPTTVTYTGGWVERTANPSAENRFPVGIERDLAWVAWALGHVEAIARQVVAGASSVQLGDVAISFESRATMRSVDDMTIKWSRRTLAYAWTG